MTLLQRIEAYLVDDWREALQWSSVRLNLALIGLNALAQIMPVLDPNIAAILPAALRGPAPGVYAVILLVLRLTKLKANG